MEYAFLLKDALANGSLSLPLRYRIATLLAGSSSRSDPDPHRPDVADHPRTQACVQVLKGGVREISFHGYDSLESVIKVFSQHGIASSDNWYSSCVGRMTELGPRSTQFYRGIGTPGRVLDERNCGGSRLIRAATLARTGVLEEDELASEIAESVSVFEAVSNVNGPGDLVLPHKATFVVRPEMAMPSYYHLLVLAYTKSWRTSERLQALRRAVDRLPRVPLAHVKHGSQLIAMAQLRASEWFNPLALTNDINKALWLDQIVELLRADILPTHRKASISRLLRSWRPWMAGIHRTGAFLKWGAYTGVALEPDWRSPARKQMDLLFRLGEAYQLMQSLT